MMLPVLSQPGRKALLTLHVASIAAVLGADLALVTLGAAALGGAQPGTIYPAAALIGNWVAAPFAVLSLVSGLLLGLLTPWGLFQHWWVTAKLAITTVLTAALLLSLAPRLGTLADADIVSAAERLPMLIAPVAASVLLAAALLLSVFKPGRRSFQVPAHEA